MTTILAIQYPDRVIFGTDSRISDSSGQTYSHPRTVKITQRGNYLLAVSGEVTALEIVNTVWRPPIPKGRQWLDLYEFAITKIIPSLKKAFTAHGYSLEKNEDGEPRFSIFISINAEIFEIDDDFAVSMKDTNFYGIGSGSDYGIGALFAGADIDKALEIAEINDIFTKRPFIIIEQVKKNRRV